MNKQIISAIHDRNILVIDYEPGRRTIEPHALGYSSDGNLLLRAYQTEGASDSGQPISWKLFRVDKIRELEPTNQHFYDPREGYRKGDSAMPGGILAEL